MNAKYEAIRTAANAVLTNQVIAGNVENTREAKVAAYRVIVEMIIENYDEIAA